LFKATNTLSSQPGLARFNRGKNGIKRKKKLKREKGKKRSDTLIEEAVKESIKSR